MGFDEGEKFRQSDEIIARDMEETGYDQGRDRPSLDFLQNLIPKRSVRIAGMYLFSKSLNFDGHAQAPLFEKLEVGVAVGITGDGCVGEDWGKRIS